MEADGVDSGGGVNDDDDDDNDDDGDEVGDDDDFGNRRIHEKSSSSRVFTRGSQPSQLSMFIWIVNRLSHCILVNRQRPLRRAKTSPVISISSSSSAGHIRLRYPKNSLLSAPVSRHIA